MGIDYRRDHSFRVPRPDLTVEIGAPNACNDCHSEQTAEWALSYIREWYGKSTKSHFGTTFAQAQEADPGALPGLIRIAKDDLFPEIVRATAVSLIGNYTDNEAYEAIVSLLTDPEPIVRYYAVRHLPASSIEELTSALATLLYDPVRAVRTEAASYLAILPPGSLDETKSKLLAEVIGEYQETMYYTADFAPSRHNLGNLYGNLGDSRKAVENYIKAIEIDNVFYPAKVNLAMAYNRQGENTKAEALFRDAIKDTPDNYELFYSLGLLLAEMGKYQESADWLENAAEGMPDRPRIFYNLGLIQEYLQNFDKAEQALLKAYELDATNQQFIYAVAQFYMKAGEEEKAQRFMQMLE
jgi:Tfp pilus assembly protein PilF